MLRLLTAIFILILVVVLPSAGAGMYIVDDDGYAKYHTIGDAIADASDGDIIYIKPGIYNEQVIVDKKIRLMPLVGENGPIILNGSENEIGMMVTADGCVIERLTIANFAGPGISLDSDENTIKNCIFENNLHGIFLNNSHSNRIENNLVNGSYVCGIVLLNSGQNTITGNTAEDCKWAGILLNSSNGNEITGNTATGCALGAYLMKSSENVIDDYSISECKAGIRLENQCEMNELVDCSVKDSTVAYAIATGSSNKIERSEAINATNGIVLTSSVKNTLIDNVIEECDYGILFGDHCSENIAQGCRVENTTKAVALGESTTNTIKENVITRATDGITLVSSDSNTFNDNLIEECNSGIIMKDSSLNLFEGSSLSDVAFGLFVDGISKESFDNTITESNLIDGLPIFYRYGQSEMQIQDSEYAHMTIAHSDNCTIEGNTITNDALFLFNSNNNDILENVISGCYGGIRLQNSAANEVTGNQVDHNRYSGIFFVESSSNQIIENTFDHNNRNGMTMLSSSTNWVEGNDFNNNNEMGIYLDNSSMNIVRSNNVDSNNVSGIQLKSSDDNKIFGNTISNNPTGTELLDSAESGIYHNNFVTNTVQASDNAGNNRWDLGPLAGGNYWSDHECMGNPSDGQPKTIGEMAVDAFPYQEMNGWLQPKYT